MEATHRVKDKDNNTLGFMIDGRFIASSLIKDNAPNIENLILQKNGAIRAKRALPELYYKDAVIKAVYRDLVQENPFERNIQSELEHWRNTRYRQVLQLGGTRQVGKTTELLKFAYKNYEYVIYVNLADDRFRFAALSDSADMWLDMQNYCDRAYLPQYRDDRNTILILDEIQTSKKVYNSIRAMRSALKCDIAVTGSYLGIVFHTEGYFLPAGTITYIDMTAMNFEEFARAFGEAELLGNIDLYGAASQQHYRKLENLYRIYRQIGGYPEVVRTYVQTESIEECHTTIGNLLRTFKEESRNYFSQPRDVEIFESVYTSALKEMCREKRGTGRDQLEIIRKLADNDTNLMINRDEVANAITWLIYTGMIATCDLAVNGDIKNISKDRRLYFSDCGIVAYLTNRTLVDSSSLEGLLTETFVFNELRYLFGQKSVGNRVMGDNVCFSTCGAYELDFMLASSDRTVYGIEAKTTKGNPLSLRVFIDKHYIDRGIVVKPTAGGHGDKFDTIPIYAVGCRFPYE